MRNIRQLTHVPPASDRKAGRVSQDGSQASLDVPDAPSPHPLPLHRIVAPPLGPPRPLTLPAGAQVWHVTRYEDVRRVLTDPRFTRAGIFGSGADGELIEAPNVMTEERSILNVDAADHYRLRRLVQRAFIPRHIATWRPWVASVIDDLVSALISAGPPADLVPTFTTVLPMRVICRLIGVPAADQPQLQSWGERAMSLSAFPAEEIRSAMNEFADYVTNLVAARRAQPSDDLLTSLITARDDGEALTDNELVSLVRDLIVGGHETTMTALGNSLIALLDDDRRLWRQLTAEPDLATTAVGELLRRVPLGDGITEAGLLRRTTEDVELGGITLPAGSIVAAGIMCANLDPATYPRPDELDITRQPATSILTFGMGPHNCLGSWLARLELELSLRHLASSLPTLRLDVAVDQLTFTTGLMTRGPAALPVTWSKPHSGAAA
jgi:cytochrome P450